MHYQSKKGDGSVTAAWEQFVNWLVVLSPGLFGCHRVSLKGVATHKEFEDLSGVLQKLGAVKIAEAHDQGGKIRHHYFRVEKKPIALLLEEQKSVKMIAPRPLIEYAENELKIVLS